MVDRIDPPIQTQVAARRRASHSCDGDRTIHAPQVEIPVGTQPMSDNTPNTQHHHYHGNGYCGNPYGNHHVDVDHTYRHVTSPATYPVRTGDVRGTEMTKDVLRIGADSYDLTSAVLGSADFRHRFLGWLVDVLSGDRNIQYAISELMSNGQAAQDAAIEAVTHAVQCAYYEDGALVFPNLENKCGKVNRVLIPPVDGIKYDAITNTLTIGMAHVVLPVNAIVASGLQAAMNAATKTMGKPRTPADISQVFVGTLDDCNPAKVADIDQFAQAIIEEGIPKLCEANKLKPIDMPTRLLSFGEKCRDFGVTSIEALLKALNNALPLAPKGTFPVELRGFGAAGGDNEQRYPVAISPIKQQAFGQSISVAGTDAVSTAVNVPILKSGLYSINAYARGILTVNIGGTLPDGYMYAVLEVQVNGVGVYYSGGSTFFNKPDSVISVTPSVSTILNIAAGSTVSIVLRVLGCGNVSSDPSLGIVGAVGELCPTVIEMNP
jgi:hypothetical protein